MTTRIQAIPTTQINNNRAIVTEWRFAPGTETGWHTHGHDYIVVPMTHGMLHLETPEGLKEFELVAGQSYTREAGVHHNVINASQHEVIFVEIEIR
jgi:quercetin dioxygenase-like cupin family protein